MFFHHLFLDGDVADVAVGSEKSGQIKAAAGEAVLMQQGFSSKRVCPFAACHKQKNIIKVSNDICK